MFNESQVNVVNPRRALHITSTSSIYMQTQQKTKNVDLGEKKSKFLKSFS